MKLILIDADFWVQNEDCIRKIMQNSNRNHDIFRSLIEDEYSSTIIANNIKFDFAFNDFIDEYNQWILCGIELNYIVFWFDN